MVLLMKKLEKFVKYVDESVSNLNTDEYSEADLAELQQIIKQ